MKMKWSAAVAAAVLASACSTSDSPVAPTSAARPIGPSAVVYSAGTVTVQPTSTANLFTEGWFGYPDRGTAVGDAAISAQPAVQTLGTGSLRMTNSAFGWEAAAYGAPAFAPGTRLDAVTALSYATYTPSGQTGIDVQHVALQFTIDYDLTDAYEGFQGRLVYEPYHCNTTSLDAWQTWNTLAESTTGCWFQTADPAGATAPRVGDVAQTGALPCPQGNPCTRAEVVAAYPNAGFHNTNGAKGLILKVGSTWAGTFYADAIVANAGGTPTTYDFEPATACTTTCFVNGTTGDDAFGGDTPGTAKKTIQAAIAQVSSGGAVVVAAGTYAESPTVSKPLTLQGPNETIHPQYGGRGAEAVMNTITIATGVDNVTIEGLRIVSATSFGITSPGNTAHSNITIRFNDFAAAYQPIHNGLGGGGGIGSANWTVSNNRISGITTAAATAIVMFNVDGVVINNNYIRHDNALVLGRRGINLDGNTNVQVTDNDIGLGLAVFDNPSLANTDAPWIIQLSMSDRPVNTVLIRGNTISGGWRGISGLSQRNLTNVTVSGNTIRNVSTAVQFNGGGAAPLATGTEMSGLTLTDNAMTAYRFGVRVLNLHAPGNAGLPGTKPISFGNIEVSRNSFKPVTALTNAQVTGIDVQDIGTIMIDGGTTASINGTCNFWNAASGPGAVASGSGLLVTGRVAYASWLETSDLDGGCVGGIGPIVTNVAVTPNPAPVGTVFTLTATATDNAAVTSASYTIEGGVAVPFTLTSGASVSLSAPVGALAVGVYDICVTAKDAGGNTSSTECTMLAVYDPTAGFVTGGGWLTSPAGAFLADPLLTGRANFGFVSKYVKGRTMPTGNTEFQFNAAGLTFSSTAYEWLVVNQAGSNAQFKGTGTLNGVAGYQFMLWAKDGAPDTFRIKISDSAGTVVYDNNMGGEFGTTLGGGNIVIHTPKR